MYYCAGKSEGLGGRYVEGKGLDKLVKEGLSGNTRVYLLKSRPHFDP